MIEVWYLISRGDEARKIEIREDDALNILKQWERKPNAQLMSTKPDGTVYLKEILNRNDWRIQKSLPKEDNSNKRWICNYGTRHPLGEQCECQKRFGVHFVVFLLWQRKVNNIEFIHEISPAMQKDYLIANRK